MTDEQLQRIHDIEYSNDGRTELAQRIVALEDKLAMYENDHQIALRTYGSWKRLKADVPKLREENEKLIVKLNAEHIARQNVEAENAKLRDAMYTNAGKHALQHMDEDELRIWATQQSEYVEELKELARDMWHLLYDWLFKAHEVPYDALKATSDHMRELGIEVDR